jgi:hypothetical protein
MHAAVHLGENQPLCLCWLVGWSNQPLKVETNPAQVTEARSCVFMRIYVRDTSVTVCTVRCTDLPCSLLSGTCPAMCATVCIGMIAS